MGEVRVGVKKIEAISAFLLGYCSEKILYLTDPLLS
jgi:hypothetical protein